MMSVTAKDPGRMAASRSEELRRVAEADDLRVAPFRMEGVTCRTGTARAGRR